MNLEPKHPVPIVPLANLVLFPFTMVSLHVPGLRQRTLVREALSGERLLVIALRKPGREREEAGAADIHRLGCLARFAEVEWLPNDTYDLKLTGVMRIEVERVVRDFPYLSARVRPLPQAPWSADDPLVQLERRALCEVCARWARATPTPDETQPSPGWGEGLDYEPLVNAAAMGLGIAATEKLELLALDSVIERGHRVRERIESRLRRTPPPPSPGGAVN